MKQFSKRQLREALTYAREGGQALHIHNVISNTIKVPPCFRRAIRNGENIAHLFDMNRERLIRTARMFGVKIIKVERAGQDGQHIDLCGTPFCKALLYCEDITQENS